MRWTGLLIALALIVGPSAHAGPPTVQVKDDKFSPAVTFIGPSSMINPFGGTTRRWFIRSWLNKSDHTVTHQLYVDTSYFWHWRFWEVAADDHAVSHPVEKIDSSVDDCSSVMCTYSETVGVGLDDAFLRSRASDGFQIKLSAKSGDELIITVSPEQIQPVLAAIDAYGKPSPRPAGAPADAPAPFGVKAQDRPGVLRMLSPCPSTRGAFLLAVTPGGVADSGGLQSTDTIIAFGDKQITGKADLDAALSAVRPGEVVKVDISASDCTTRTASLTF